MQQMVFDMKTKYFKLEEGRETLKSETFSNEQPLITKKYSYNSGAVYNGQWKGGLRHGAGTMIWPDGAKYNGHWDLN